MEGFDVHFLMGNDENTHKVSKRAAELGFHNNPAPTATTWPASSARSGRRCEISYDDFIQTSEPRHHGGCQKFIQAVYDAGDIYEGVYEGCTATAARRSRPRRSSPTASARSTRR